ncbi:MAG TPA: hypothetical protein VKB69_05265 [Micromonosporaceae bacterium]|nr:hypothetical protein [Micromonosporaceae bacterium]
MSLRQLSLFGIEAGQPEMADLAGLLAGPGQVVKMGGTARVSVVVEDRWRAAVLVGELRARSFTATCVATEEQHVGVRTQYSTRLAPLAVAWLRDSVKLPPPGFGLNGRRLRLWMTAAGYRDGNDLVLRIGPCEEGVPVRLQRALAAIGLPSDVVTDQRGSGQALRVSGRRRLNRFAEVVGEAPLQAPEGAWP